MGNKKGRDYTRLLMIGAALVVVIRYAAAFTASDVGEITGTMSTVTTVLMAISGIGMGFLVVFGQIYTFDGWKRSLPKAGQKWAFRFMLLTLVSVLLIIVDVAILVPFTVSRITHMSMDSVLGQGLTWWWSGVVNAAPALLLAGVALGNSVVTTQANGTANGANGSPNSGTNGANGSRTFASLTNSDKYLILNSDSKTIAADFGVTARAIQKWRVRIQAEVEQGKL
jgi:hypothetical protein